ncbi:MAG TPA: sigma-54 dependent transcriptional regulator [Blastocatellia bacterium]|nr:sigma-54 dependent transcriptional regulator [Blastocatellia bacterium]
MKSTVLIVDDEPAARYGMRRALEKEGHRIFEADSIGNAEQMVETHDPGVVLLDVKLASESGLDYLPKLVSRRDAPLVIIVTAHGSERLAVEAIKLGAYDYLAKPFDVEELRILIRNATEAHRLRSENELLRNELTGTESFGQLIGSSPAMKRLFSLIEKVALTDASVLITGESGTGKEMVAREIHARSRVSSGPFVAINCAAMPEELIESELFGHEKGAFTGAGGRRVGKFEAADKGTLFLDEIGDMSLSTQAKVLRVLDEKKFQRLGSNETISTDARIISATNKDLEKMVENQQFREDLFYRLCVIRVLLPPLRERKDDIPSLAHAFGDRYSLAYRGNRMKLERSALKALLDYDWPGNVRQLRNYMERAVILSEGEEVTLDSLPELSASKEPENKETPEGDEGDISVPSSLSFKDAKKEFERKYVERCLEKASGNITQAAAILGMHRQSLQHKIKELGLTKKFVISE